MAAHGEARVASLRTITTLSLGILLIYFLLAWPWYRSIFKGLLLAFMCDRMLCLSEQLAVFDTILLGLGGG